MSTIEWSEVDTKAEKNQRFIERIGKRVDFEKFIEGPWKAARDKYKDEVLTIWNSKQQCADDESEKDFCIRTEIAVEKATYKKMDCGKGLDCTHTECEKRRRDMYNMILRKRPNRAKTDVSKIDIEKSKTVVGVKESKKPTKNFSNPYDILNE